MCNFQIIAGDEDSKTTQPDDVISSKSDSMISTRNIEMFVDKLKMERFRGSTRSNYYTIWKCFNEFFINLDLKPNNWEDRLTLFVGYLVNRKRRSATIKSYISAIKAVLLDGGMKLQEDKCLLGSLTKACRLHNDQVNHRIPIQKHLLHMIIDGCTKNFEHQGQMYLKLMYRAALTISYYGLLRVGEVTAGDHPILAVDVHIAQNKNKIMLILRSSKTHGKGDKPQIIKIKQMSQHYTTHRNYCPFQIMKQFAEIHPTCKSPHTELFFVFADRSAVRPDYIHSILKQAIKKLGFDDQLYQMHGLHSGRACDLCDMGISVETIKKLGRWCSNAVYVYLR